MVAVKICGVNSDQVVQAAVSGGARYIGLVFYPASPRAVEPDLAARLVQAVPTSIRTVGVFVNPTLEYLDDILSSVRLDLLQLHGNESIEEVSVLRKRRPIMKAFSIAHRADLEGVERYFQVVDRLLFDAKPGPASLPGGNGDAFDWQVLNGFHCPCDWVLSGGLNLDNLAAAVSQTGAQNVDVSSGVEIRPGLKDPHRIQEFFSPGGLSLIALPDRSNRANLNSIEPSSPLEIGVSQIRIAKSCIGKVAVTQICINKFGRA